MLKKLWVRHANGSGEWSVQRLSDLSGRWYHLRFEKPAQNEVKSCVCGFPAVWDGNKWTHNFKVSHLVMPNAAYIDETKEKDESQ